MCSDLLNRCSSEGAAYLKQYRQSIEERRARQHRGLGGAGPDGHAARRGQMSDHPVHLYARCYCSQSHPQTLLTVPDTASQGRGNYHGQLWIRPSVSSFAPGCAGQPVLGLTVKGNKWERREPVSVCVCVWRSAINCLLCQGTVEGGR